MSNAKHDNNNVPTFTGTLQSDGFTVIRGQVNPTNNAIKVVNGTSGTNIASAWAQRDSNNAPVMMGVSSVDGKTLVPIAFDSNGNILIQST